MPEELKSGKKKCQMPHMSSAAAKVLLTDNVTDVIEMRLIIAH